MTSSRRRTPGGALPSSALNLYDPADTVEYRRPLPDLRLGAYGRWVNVEDLHDPDLRDVRTLPLPAVPV